MKAFKETTVDIGEVVMGSSDNEVFFPFEDLTPDGIATYDLNGEEKYAIKKGCGCTAKIKVTEDGIHAVYNDSSNSTGTFRKNITVYLKYGAIPTRKKNSRGVLAFNSSLPKVALTFTYKVVA